MQKMTFPPACPRQSPALSPPASRPQHTAGLDGTVTFAPVAVTSSPLPVSPPLPSSTPLADGATLNPAAAPFAPGGMVGLSGMPLAPGVLSAPGMDLSGSAHPMGVGLPLGMQPMGAGITTITPAGAPFMPGGAGDAAAAAAGAPVVSMPMVVDAAPRVETPPDEDIELPIDLINGLQSLGSTDLMLTDDLSKDEVWEALFGAGGAAAAAAAAAHQQHGGGAVGADAGSSGGGADG